MKRALAMCAVLALVACGGAPPVVVTTPPAQTVHGTVRYEARSATQQGLSIATQMRPSRQVDIVARDMSGQPLASTRTADDGTFTLPVPSGAVDLVVVAHATQDGAEVSVARDPNGTLPHELRIPLAGIRGEAAIDVRDASPDGFAGALHLLDTLLLGTITAQRWTGAHLPPLYAYWGRGVTTVWSFYHRERPAGSGRFALELMGGEPGRRETTDSDDHDEAIVLHELGHFVFDRLAGDSSIGGLHPASALLDPGLAWEEGRATWFATAVLGEPFYRDTIGMEPRGRLRVDYEIETGMHGVPRGNGSESSVEAVLWDLSDGVAGQPDRDHDGVALGPEALLRAMIAMGHEPGAYPCLATFLRYLVRTGAVTEPAMKIALGVAGESDALLPRTDAAPWPLDLALPARVTGKVDGVTRPALGGGEPRPGNGESAVHAYRVTVPHDGRLVLTLTIAGSGRAADHEDVDLELRDTHAQVLAVSNAESQVETVNRQVTAGTYIVYARDGGSGNRAGYDLEARLE